MEKGIFQGFSVFHLYGFYAVSAFLGAFFLAAIEKKRYLCNRKNKVRGFQARASNQPQSCQQASKN